MGSEWDQVYPLVKGEMPKEELIGIVVAILCGVTIFVLYRIKQLDVYHTVERRQSKNNNYRNFSGIRQVETCNVG